MGNGRGEGRDIRGWLKGNIRVEASWEGFYKRIDHGGNE